MADEGGLGLARLRPVSDTAAYLAAVSGVALTYFMLAKLGLMLASVNPSATPVWPPTGFALAALLIWGYRLSPAILIGAFAANATTAGTLATSSAIAAGNSLEAIFGAWLINIWSQGRYTFNSPIGVAKFALISLVPSTMLSATIGVVSLSLAGYADWAKFSSIWTTWWLGDLTGAVIFTPVIVLWAISDVRRLTRSRLTEDLIIFVTATVIAVITFSPLFEYVPLFEQRVYGNALGFLIVIPLLWAALRTSQRETATVAVILSLIAVIGTYAGSGPFARSDTNESFIFLLMFVISLSLPSLALSADVEQRRHIEQQLRHTQTELDRQIEERTAELANTEQQFRLLIRSVVDCAIYMLDADGHVRSWNSGAERIKGYTAEEIIGRHFSRFFTEQDQQNDLPRRALRQAEVTGKFEEEAWRVRKDGTRFWAHTLIHPIRDASGNLIGFAKITRDTTERKELDEKLQQSRDQLQQAQKMDAIGQLTGGIAHDFNNLLMVILGNLEIAERNLEPPMEENIGRLHRTIGSAMRGARRAATLTQRLLAFSRRQPLVPKRLDVNKFISSEIDFLQRTLGETIDIQSACGAGLWQVELDDGQLAAAILNLAVNARDAMPNGGKLTIETSNSYLDADYCAASPELRPGQYVQISVTDSGVGMTSDVIERAFEPFFSTKPAGEGTGLGLSQVYGFVKQSRGHVKIYSEAGQGTTVKLYFPRLLGDANIDETLQPEQKVDGRRGETILVVEDDELVRIYLVEILRDLKYNILEAGEARSALQIIKQYDVRIDLVLSDIVLPGINGRELASQAQALRPDLKILFMTGYSRNAVIHQGRLDPGVEMIQKPVTQATLAARIRDLLDAPRAHA